MLSKIMVRGFLAAALVAAALTAQADVFNMGGTISGGTWTGLASLSFVTVGDPGNVADPYTGSQFGSVPYTYQMGTYDVTVAQYVAFLNSVATQSDPYGLYNLYMTPTEQFNTVGISQTSVAGSYSYAVWGTAPGAANMPIWAVTWGDAARFCNWLQNGQPTSGTEAAGTTETGAYTLNGDTLTLTETRNAGATYFIPSENEWYKAAYYSGGGTNSAYYIYPTRSNTPPINILSPTGTNNVNDYDQYGTGNGGFTDPTNFLTPVGSFADSPGPYGTYDMGGDVIQWNEAIDSGSLRGIRGGGWGNNSYFMDSDFRFDETPVYEFNGDVGFRVASIAAVPEPGSLALLLAGAVAFGIWRQRRRA